MNRRKIAAVALCLMLPFATAAKCKKEDGASPEKDAKPKATSTVKRTNCPDIEWRADYERCFTLQTFVETRLGPYDVYLEIKGGNGVYPKEIPQSGGGWTHSLVYRAGAELSIKLTLRYEGAESKDGFCSITDGSELYKTKLKSITAGGGSPYEAVCALTTSQT